MENYKMYTAIDFYLELKKSRRYVGRLTKEKGKFVFQYDKSYLESGNAIALGPDIPLSKDKKVSLKLFPSLADRIPSKHNPAYVDYCKSVGIDPLETDPFLLLAKLGKKAPSSFICAPVKENTFSRGKLKQFRRELRLSIREFADLFAVSSATIYRIENNKTSGRDTLKKIAIYYKTPQTALAQMQITGDKINEQKRVFVENFFKLKMNKKSIKNFPELKIGGYTPPITVAFKDIQKSKPEQAVELIKRLSLLECAFYNIPQNSVHFSGSISAGDGGQNGLVNWSQSLPYTNYFPRRYNCLQIKTSSLSSTQCIKEIYNTKTELKPALKNVIKKKGAYILCSTQPLSGVHVQAREEALRGELNKAGYDSKQFVIKFYDANKIADWLNQYPSLVIWFLKEVCDKPIRPWISWEEWSREDPDYKSEFMYSEDLYKKQNDIYNILSQPGKTAHLSGAGGTGKTRLALEIFRSQLNENNNASQSFSINKKSGTAHYPDLSYSVSYSSSEAEQVYHRQNDSNLSYSVLYSSAEELKPSDLRELKTSRAILVIDDCPPERLEDFHKIALQEDSQLSLLSIGNEDTEKDLRHIIREIFILKPDEEVVKKMLLSRQNITNQYIDRKYIDLTAGFPLMATRLKNLGPLRLLKEDLSSIRKKMLWGQDQPDKEGDKVIKACALFDIVGLLNESQRGFSRSLNKDRGEDEAKYIAKKICEMKYNDFYKKIQFFKKKQILQQYGRFIQVRPKPLAVWLAQELIKESPPGTITKWFSSMKVQLTQEEQDERKKMYENIPETDKKNSEIYQSDFLSLKGLRESFCKQLSYLPASPELKKLVEKLCDEKSPLGNLKTLCSEWSFRCLYHIVELNPEAVLTALERVFLDKSKEELKNIPIKNYSLFVGTQFFPELIWTLEKLAREKDFYERSAQLLLQFAEIEEESKSGQAQKVFIEHFYLFYSGTSTEPKIKFQIIGDIRNSKSIKKKEIALQALSAVFEREGVRHSSDFMTKKDGEVIKEWRPQNLDEEKAYFRKALDELLEFSDKKEDAGIQKKAQKIIVSKLAVLLDEKLYDTVKKAVRKIVSLNDELCSAIVEELECFLNYHSKAIETEGAKKIQSLIEGLKTNKNFNQRIQFYIAHCPSTYVYRHLEEKEYPENDKQFKKLLKEFKNLIEKRDKKKIESALDILFYGDQRNTGKFAFELAGLLKHPDKFSSQLLDIIKNRKEDKNFNPIFLSSFIKGLNEKSPAKTKQVLDQIAGGNELMSFLIPAYLFLDLQDHDLKRLTAVINEKPFEFQSGHSILGLRLQAVSLKVIEKFILALLKKSNSFLWEALRIYVNCLRLDKQNAKKQNKKEDIEINQQRLLPTLFDLLTRENIFLFKKNYDSLDDYFYKSAVEIILNSEHGELFSQKFFSQIFEPKVSLFKYAVSHFTIKECLVKISQRYPERVLQEIANHINNSKIKFLFCDKSSFQTSAGLTDKQGVLSHLLKKEKLCKQWCEKMPHKLPVFFARHMNLFFYNREKDFYTLSRFANFAKFLLDKYGDQKQLTEAISMNLGNFTWSGNLSDYFKKVRKALEELKQHKQKNVRDFIFRHISYIDKRLEQFQKEEEEREKLGIW